MIFNKLYFLILTCAGFAASAESLKVYSWNDPVFLADGHSTTLPARGEELTSTFVQIGQAAGIALDGSEGTQISIIGPALVRYLRPQNLFILDYGEAFIHGGSNSDITFRTGNIVSKLAGKEFFAEVGVEQNFIRIKNLGASIALVGGAKIQAQQLFFRSENFERISSTSVDDLQLQKERHNNNRARKALQEREAKSDLSDADIRAFFEGGASLGLKKSAYRGAGIFARIGSQRYFRLPTRPERIHYLRYPSFRYGLQAKYGINKIHDQQVEQDQAHSAGLAALVGLGWLGVSFDLLGGLQSDSSAQYRYQSSLWYQAQVGYRFDLYSWFDSELGLVIESYLSRAQLQYRHRPVFQKVYFFGLQAGLSARF